MDYNHYRQHSSLDYMAPVFTAKCLEAGCATLGLTQDNENECDNTLVTTGTKTGAGQSIIL